MNINKFLHWVTLMGLFIIPFVPLIVTSSAFFPFITGKNFAFRVIIEIVFASWLILALRDKSYWPKKSYLLYTVLALLVVTGLATIFGENLSRSFWSNYERMGGYVSLLHLGAYFIVLISFLRNKGEWFWLANTSLGVNWLIALYSLSQLMGKTEIHQGGVRLDATLGNAAYLAVYVLFGIFISSYLLSQAKNIWLKIFYGLTAFVNLFLLYNTATRGTILGLIVGLVVFAGLVILRGERKQKQWAGGILLALALLVGGFLLAKDSSFVTNSPVLSRFSSISATEATTQSRFLIWNMSLQGFKEHPVLGWGPENYSMVFSKYYDPAMWRQEPWFDRSHNIFFDWLIDAGLLGLLAYLSIFIGVFYLLWTKREKFGFGGYLLVGLIVAYLFHNIFVFDNLVSYLYFFAVVAYINFLSMKDDEEGVALKVKTDYQADKKKISATGNITLGVNVASGIILVLLVGTLYYVNYKPWSVSTDLIRAIHPNAVPEKSLVIFQDIFKRSTLGSGEALEQLVNKTMNIVGNEKVSNELKIEFVKLSDEQIKIYLTRFGQDARSLIFFGSYLTSTGRVDEGLALLQKAQTISPKKQQVLFQLVATYVQKQDAVNAVKIAKMAYELDPTYQEARKIYALILFMTGQTKLGYEIIAPIKNDSGYFTDQRFFNVYAQMGDVRSIQEMKDSQSKK